MAWLESASLTFLDLANGPTIYSCNDTKGSEPKRRTLLYEKPVSGEEGHGSLLSSMSQRSGKRLPGFEWQLLCPRDITAKGERVNLVPWGRLDSIIRSPANASNLGPQFLSCYNTYSSSALAKCTDIHSHGNPMLQAFSPENRNSQKNHASFYSRICLTI